MIPPFQLSQADSRPMYQQILANIKRLIFTGQWPEGHALPSIRELAVALKVSVITVKRAYQELENQRVIVTRQGLGSFVAERGNVNEQKQAELVVLADALAQQAQDLSISIDDVLALVRERIKRLQNKGKN